MSAILPITTVEKPWGKDRLPPPFVAPEGKRIGEVWFTPPAQLDELLVKYIFTSEKLSVQVHPSDEQTLAKGLGRQGKEECWLVIAAEPGATLGIGFREPIDSEAMRAAALDGSIEDMLVWHEVSAGDFFYIPANTVHAIGAGVSLIEVQQNSDITYRLYDYGRPRELHLEDGVAVAKGKRYDDPRQSKVPERGEVLLVDGPLFRLVRYDGPLSLGMASAFATGPTLVIPETGGASVSDEPVSSGQCALAPIVDKVVIAEGVRGLIAQPLS